MRRSPVLSLIAACAVAAPVVAGVAVAAPSSTRPEAVRAHVAGKGKDKDKDKDKKDDAPTPPAAPPAPAPTPAPPAPAPASPGPTAPPAPAPAAPPAAPPATNGEGHGRKGKDDKGKDPGRTTTQPTPPPTVPPVAVPPVSSAPTVAFDTPALTPTLGRSVGVAAARGTVQVRTGTDQPTQPLAAATAIPTGARVDARSGTVELSTAVAGDAVPQTATFTGAVFEVHQAATAGGLTRIVLKGGDFRRCGAHAASAARRKRRGKPVRSLWGNDDHGRFQTEGTGAVGTVRGTRWLTEDYCGGTLTRVVEGAVSVRDLARRKTVLVRAGHSYFAAR